MGRYQPLKHGSTFMYLFTELNSQKGQWVGYRTALDFEIRLIIGTDSCVWVLAHEAVPGRFQTCSKYFCFSPEGFFKIIPGIAFIAAITVSLKLPPHPRCKSRLSDVNYPAASTLLCQLCLISET